MNSLPVLSVLDDALDSLRLLSFVTAEVLDTAEQLQDLLGEDLVNTLAAHRDLISASKSNLGSEAVIASTWQLTRLLKMSSTAHRLQTLHTERSPAVLQVVNFCERLRTYTQKRLTTTVEEDASNREFYEEVKAREEKAVAEKVQLEQKLKLQRVELQRQANAVQSAEDTTRAEIHMVNSNTSALKNSIEADAGSTRKNDFASYEGEHGTLSMELSAAKEALARLRQEHKEAEAALRKNKKRAAQDVEAVISEYDTDVGSKESEYQAALAEYNEVLRQLDEYTKGAAEMAAERVAYEEEEKRKAEAKLQAALQNVRMNRAARVIQGNWKAYKARKAAELKKKKKLEAAKKKKK